VVNIDLDFNNDLTLINTVMQSSFNDTKLLEVLQGEKFLAFFDFCKIQDNGTSLIDGLCKVAVPTDDSLTYLSLTFIFDTPSEAKHNMAIRIVSALTKDKFHEHIPEVYAITSVTGTMRQGEHYVHHIDLMFKNKFPADMQDLIKKVVYVIRHAADIDTEIPQWWEDSDTPNHTQAEKASFAGRVKAFLGIKL